ncbi:WXG100 family type VII secretion target [Streptomyces sp. NPDC097619]|uniref:WXG100 family type VII secretion target n=1 Tax=Streptomyces sp. NPDC097619 TaxID=3157228 RepID=UPI00331669FC
MAMNLQVDEAEKQRLAGEISTFHAELTGRISALNDVVDRIQAGWKGAAGQQYDALQRGVNDHLTKIRGKLVELEEAMRLSARGFTAEEQQRIADIRRLATETGTTGPAPGPRPSAVDQL